MNQLAYKTIENLFLQKNPNGSIWQEKKNNYNICFSSGKCYTYNVDNHKDLANKLKLDIKFIYQRELESYQRAIEESQKILSGDPIYNDWLDDYYIPDDEARKNAEYNIKCYTDKINNAIVI